MTAQALVARFPDDRRPASRPRRTSSPRCRASGPSWPRRCAQYLDDEHNRRPSSKLRDAAEAPFVEELPASRRGPLSGKTFVLTGKLARLTPRRGPGRHRAAGRPGRAPSVGATDYVVVGRRPRVEAREGPQGGRARCWTRRRSSHCSARGHVGGRVSQRRVSRANLPERHALPAEGSGLRCFISLNIGLTSVRRASVHVRLCDASHLREARCQRPCWYLLSSSGSPRPRANHVLGPDRRQRRQTGPRTPASSLPAPFTGHDAG